MAVVPSFSKRSYLDSRLQVDLAFPVKFHRPILGDPDVRALVEARFRAIAKSLDVVLLNLEVHPDHVRLRAELPPDLSPLALVTKLKADSTHALFMTFPALKSKIASIWTWSAFFRSHGNQSPGAVDDYLAKDRGIHYAP